MDIKAGVQLFRLMGFSIIVMMEYSVKYSCIYMQNPTKEMQSVKGFRFSPVITFETVIMLTIVSAVLCDRACIFSFFQKGMFPCV